MSTVNVMSDGRAKREGRAGHAFNVAEKCWPLPAETGHRLPFQQFNALRNYFLFLYIYSIYK